MPLPLIPLAISAISSIAGGLANRSSTPPLDPALRSLRNALIQQQFNLMSDSGSGYLASQTDDLNRSFDLQRQSILEKLAAHGVSGPAVGFAEANLERNRFSAINKLRQQLPFISASYGTNLFSSLAPSGTGTAGNVAGGALGNLAPTLAYLYGQGAFSPITTTTKDPSGAFNPITTPKDPAGTKDPAAGINM